MRSRFRFILMPLLILLIAVGVYVQQRRETAANLVRVDSFLTSLLESSESGKLPSPLPVSVPMLDEPVRRALEAITAEAKTIRVMSRREHDRYVSELHADGSVRLTVTLEVSASRIVICGYELPTESPRGP